MRALFTLHYLMQLAVPIAVSAAVRMLMMI